jgi:LAGLIDADG DNA endonuclease family
VPLNIGELLTPVGLAHWILGEGYWCKKTKAVFFCTEGFTDAEVYLLIKVLKDNFNVQSAAQKRVTSTGNKGLRIRTLRKSATTLELLVLPYIIEGILYKLGRTQVIKKEE